jgi:hypothetical protein
MVVHGTRIAQPDKPDNLSVILADITEHLCDRYTFPSEDDAYLIAVWIVHCWLIAAFEKTPYLLITAPGPDYGKTEIAKALRDICPNGRHVIAPTTAALARFTTDGSNTLIIDEFDRTLRRNQSDREMFYQFADAGVDRKIDGYMAVADRTADDPNTNVYRSTFGPKAFVGIHTIVEGTLLTRTIRIPTKKGNAAEQTERRLRQTKRPIDKTANALQIRLQNFVTPEIIAKAREMTGPDNPNNISLGNGHGVLINRDGVVWSPLFIVGDIAGTYDGKRIREIAIRHTIGGIIEPDIFTCEADQIDNAFIGLFRSGRLPVHNYRDRMKPPIPDNTLAMSNDDFGWRFNNRRPNNDTLLPTVSLICDVHKKHSEIRIRVNDFSAIAKALGWTERDIKRIYSEANRLHVEKGRNDIKLQMFSGIKSERLIAINWSSKIFGTDESISMIDRIITAETEREMWDADL